MKFLKRLIEINNFKKKTKLMLLDINQFSNECKKEGR